MGLLGRSWALLVGLVGVRAEWYDGIPSVQVFGPEQQEEAESFFRDHYQKYRQLVLVKMDLVSDILGEEPRSVPVSERSRPSLRRSSTEPLVKEEADTSRRREEPEASRDFRRGLNRSRFGMPDPSQSGGSDAAFSEGRFDESEGRPSGPLEGGRFEVELNPRTKRSLPKAKPSPSSSRVNTPGPEPENPPAASTPQRPPRATRISMKQGAPSELAQPQPSRASEHSTSGRGSLRVPPTLPLHQAVATKAHASDSSRQARQGDTSGMPATEGTRAAAISQVRQESTVPIAKLLAEQEAARRLPTPGDADDTPPSQRDVSFFDVGNRGFSDKPPATSAPDLYLQVAQKDAKVRHLELQLEDCEERWKRRMEDAKRQENESLARMELQCRYLQSELDRCKEIQASDERRFIEQKRQLAQGHQTEKEDAIREERRKVQTELDKMKSDHRLEIEELKRQHERAVTIIKQQADVEADNLRRAQTGEQHLTKLVEQVRGSVAEVERLSKRVDSDKSLEWSVRERQVEARERNAKELEAQLSRQSKEVEEQRRRLSDLVTNLQNCQDEDSTVLASERERLQAEHQRLLELQQSIREADRNQKEFLKHAWAQAMVQTLGTYFGSLDSFFNKQVEEERRILQQEQLRFDGEHATRKEELEMQDDERQLKSETDRLKALHQQIEVARQSAARRIRETESTVANERRCLMNDLEAFEEKRRSHASQAMKLESDRRQLQEEKGNFEGELHSVGLMAQELERRSEEIRVLHEEAAEARGELQLLRGQLQESKLSFRYTHEERSAQGTEMERLKTMQSLIEQQRLQLLQTENQLRLQGVEERFGAAVCLIEVRRSLLKKVDVEEWIAIFHLADPLHVEDQSNEEFLNFSENIWVERVCKQDIDLQVTTQGHFPAELNPVGNAQEAWQ
eukprot:g25669.t1